MIASLLVSGVTAAVLLAGSMRVNGTLAWLVAAPFVTLGRPSTRWRDGALCGAVFGAAAGVMVHTSWLATTAEHYFGLQPQIAAAAALGLALATGTTQGALLGCGLYAASRMPGAWMILVGGCVWTAWEWLELRLFPYYPWASLALGSARLDPNHAANAEGSFLLAAGSILGAPGVSLFLCAFGLALGNALFGSARLPRRLAAAQAALVLLLVATLGWTAPREQRAQGATCEVEVVDAGAPEAALSSNDLAAASRVAASQWRTPPAALVWSESALERSPELDAGLRANLRALAQDLGTVVIAGGPRVAWTGSWSERRFNSAFRIDGGEALRSYDKRRIVPFTEYWPLPSISPPAAFQIAPVESGAAGILFDAGACRLAPMICFEAESPALAREAARNGANAIVILTNDVPLPAAAVEMEVAQARWRAVETGLPVIRAGNGRASLMALPRGDYQLPPRLRVPRAQLAPAVWISPVLEGVAFVVAAMAVLLAVTSDASSRFR